jgi:hypothetical protein
MESIQKEQQNFNEERDFMCNVIQHRIKQIWDLLKSTEDFVKENELRNFTDEEYDCEFIESSLNHLYLRTKKFYNYILNQPREEIFCLYSK